MSFRDIIEAGIRNAVAVGRNLANESAPTAPDSGGGYGIDPLDGGAGGWTPDPTIDPSALNQARSAIANSEVNLAVSIYLSPPNNTDLFGQGWTPIAGQAIGVTLSGMTRDKNGNTSLIGLSGRGYTWPVPYTTQKVGAPFLSIGYPYTENHQVFALGSTAISIDSISLAISSVPSGFDVPQGTCYAVIQEFRFLPDGSVVTIATRAANYITNLLPIGFPGSPIQRSIDPAPFRRTIALGTQASPRFIVLQPGGAITSIIDFGGFSNGGPIAFTGATPIWKVKTIEAQVSTDAQAGSRNLSTGVLTFGDNVGRLTVPFPFAAGGLAPSAGQVILFAPDAPFFQTVAGLTDPTNILHAWMPTEWWMRGRTQDVMFILGTNISVAFGDKLIGCVIEVDEWLDV